MEALSFRNNYIENQQPELNKRLSDSVNFKAVNANELQEDTLQLENQPEKPKHEGPFYDTLKTMFGIDLDNPKKTAKSFVLSVITIVLVTFLAKKAIKPSGKLGGVIDDFLTGDNFIGKTRSEIIDLFKKGFKQLDKLPKPKFVKNVQKALQNPAKQKWSAFRGLENGAKGLFSNTISETISTAVKKDKGDALKTLTKLLGNNAQKAEEFINELAKEASDPSKLTNVQFADKLIQEIKIANNCVDNPKALEEIFEKLSNGDFGSGLTRIKMNKGGLMGSWVPANIINDVSKLLTGKEHKALQGDLGESLIKYAAIRGKLAKTLPAKAVQIIPPLVGDYIGNFTNDMSTFGVILCGNLMANFNKLQDTPNDKKVVTAANEVASGSLNWLFGLPLAYGTTYTLATLAKTEGKDIMSRLIRTVGKVFALGLNQPGTIGGLKGILGGVGRFIVIAFIFSPYINNKISKICAKILGKPYDADEAEKQKKLEEQKNTIVPELGITQGELQKRIENNPAAIQKMQNNPKLTQAIDKNPKLLLDLLDGKEINPDEVLNKPTTQSPMLQNMIKNGKPISNQADLFGSKTKEKTPQEQNTKIKDTATYIPNSQFTAPRQEISPQLQEKYNYLLSRADVALKNAEKFI